MNTRQQPPHLRILYRGPLSSCNYDCTYCPFAKRRDSPDTLRADRAALARFVGWATTNPESYQQLSVLFTPWGEALTRSWYRSAMIELSHLAHTERVAVQTNLSCRIDWLRKANKDRIALWVTYHPSQVDFDRFVAKCHDLQQLDIRYSVGIVGQPENHDAAIRLRRTLSKQTYVWVNAADGHRYSETEIDRWHEIDPHFHYSVTEHRSFGQPCRTGHSVISVDGAGTVRRCHFVDTILGNLYDGSYQAALRPRLCPNSLCDCHIGYVHMPSLPLYTVFDGGVLERIPAPHGECDHPGASAATHRARMTVAQTELPTTAATPATGRLTIDHCCPRTRR